MNNIRLFLPYHPAEPDNADAQFNLNMIPKPVVLRQSSIETSDCARRRGKGRLGLGGGALEVALAGTQMNFDTLVGPDLAWPPPIYRQAGPYHERILSHTVSTPPQGPAMQMNILRQAWNHPTGTALSHPLPGGTT